MEAEQRKRKRRHDTQARKHTSFQVSRYPEHVFYVRRGSFPNNMAARSVECTYAFNMEYGRISFYEQQLAAVRVSEFKLIKRRELHLLAWGNTKRPRRRNPPTQIDTMAGYRMLEPYLDKCGRIGNVILQTLKKKGKGNTAF